MHVPVICDVVAGNVGFSLYTSYISGESKFAVVGIHFLECLFIFFLHELCEVGPGGQSLTTVQDVDHFSEAVIFNHQQRPHVSDKHVEDTIRQDSVLLWCT